MSGSIIFLLFLFSLSHHIHSLLHPLQKCYPLLTTIRNLFIIRIKLTVSKLTHCLSKAYLILLFPGLLYHIKFFSYLSNLYERIVSIHILYFPWRATLHSQHRIIVFCLPVQLINRVPTILSLIFPDNLNLIFS